MALNITSKQTTIKLGPHKGEDMYVMKVDHYSTLEADKIIRYASETCGIPKVALRQAWEALGSVITESDIFRRKLLLTPAKEIKDALNFTPISIICYDKDGAIVK